MNVHKHDDYLAKIIYLKDLNKIPWMRVTMDTLIDRAVIVILKHGAVFKFKGCGQRLFSYDMTSTDVHDIYKKK